MIIKKSDDDVLIVELLLKKKQIDFCSHLVIKTHAVTDLFLVKCHRCFISVIKVKIIVSRYLPFKYQKE